MRDLLNALEGIQTNKKKPLNIAKELNKKPAVMKALSLESETNEADDKMPLKADVMKCCKEGMSKTEVCKKYPDCDQDKLKEMYESCMSEMKESTNESVESETSDVNEQPVPRQYTMPISKHLMQLDDMQAAMKREVLKIPSMDDGDLTDQVTTMMKLLDSFDEVMQRSFAIIPESKEETTEDTLGEGGGRDMDCPKCDGKGSDKEGKECKTCNGSGEAGPGEDDYGAESMKENDVDELEMKSEEQNMETNQKDTVEVAVEDLARVLELAGLGKEVISAEAQAEEAQVEAPVEATSEVELDEYSNSPDEDYFDADTQLNKMSGGLNGPKKQFKKEYPGDNPLAVDLQDKLAKMLSDM